MDILLPLLEIHLLTWRCLVPIDLISLYFRASEDHDTVGAVALDHQGNIAFGTSTGGITAKHPGRVGDSPLVGG